MGLRQSRIQGGSAQTIDSIYSMFQQSNLVVLQSLRATNPSLTQSRIKNIESVVEQLLQPFKQNAKFSWGQQIYSKFKRHFTEHFEALWTASREQFYQLLIINCKISPKELAYRHRQLGSYQECFYRIAAEQLEKQLSDTFTEEHEEIVKHNLQTLSIIGQEISLQIRREELGKHQEIPFLAKIQERGDPRRLKDREEVRQERVQSSSLVLPQTLFANRFSVTSQQQVYDLLKFYKQFAISLQQIFCSNNLISCPIKNFIFCLSEKLARKKIKIEQWREQQLPGSLQEYRRICKIRQANTNHLLLQIKQFLSAYTEFVWMFLQLHRMEDSNLSKIIQAEILYGIVFKNLWTFVDWIADRGYEFQEMQLDLQLRQRADSSAFKLPQPLMESYVLLVDQLRGEKHPQMYLKKVVVFYRQVSKVCQNADELLSIYEQVIGRVVRERGGKNLGLFRMRNLVDKLLNIENSSLSGGEITYSWTTWCILIELLREKVNYKYGDLIISKKMSGGEARESEIILEEGLSEGKKERQSGGKEEGQGEGLKKERKGEQETCIRSP